MQKSNEKNLSQKFEIEELEKLLTSFRTLVKKLSVSETSEITETKKIISSQKIKITEMEEKINFLNNLLQSQKEVVCSELSMNNVIRLTANNLVLSRSHRVDGFQNILSSIHHKEHYSHEDSVIKITGDMSVLAVMDEIPEKEEMVGIDILDSEFNFNLQPNLEKQKIIPEIKKNNFYEKLNSMKKIVNDGPVKTVKLKKEEKKNVEVINEKFEEKLIKMIRNGRKFLNEIETEKVPPIEMKKKSLEIEIISEMTGCEVDNIKQDSMILDLFLQSEVEKEVVRQIEEEEVKILGKNGSTKITNPDVNVRALIKRNYGSFRGMPRTSVGGGRGSYNVRKGTIGTGQGSGQGVYTGSDEGYASIYKDKENEKEMKGASVNAFTDKNNRNFVNIYKDKLAVNKIKDKKTTKNEQKKWIAVGQRDKLQNIQTFSPKSPYSKNSSEKKKRARDQNKNEFEDKENFQNNCNIYENFQKEIIGNCTAKGANIVRASGIISVTKRISVTLPGN